MHTGQVAYTPYPQLDVENERQITEIVCRNYPHPPPVAIDDLSSEHKEILESVSLSQIYCTEGGGRGAIAFVKLIIVFARAPLHPNRSYKEVGGAFRNAVARRAGTRPSLMKRGSHYHLPRA